MLRTRIAKALDQAGLLSAALALRARTSSPWLPVLTYHRIASQSRTSLFDEEVVDATAETFERQLTFLKRWFSIVDLDDVLAFQAGKPLPPNPVLVTFDDGYRDNVEVALPILERHGVRATFFIATDYIEERRLFWWDHISFLLKSSTRESIVLTYPVRKALLLRTHADCAAAIHYALRIVKDHYGLDLARFLAELAQAAGVSLNTAEERKVVDSMIMTWDDVRTLRRAGMNVQSHTRTHRVLQTMPNELLTSELSGSRETLENVLGERVRAVSYPTGRSVAAPSALRDAVRAAGYELGFSYATGVNRVRQFDPFDAKRLALGADLSDSQFRAMLAVPYFAY